MTLEQEAPATAARTGKLAGKTQQKGCWPCRKQVEEVPLFDDVNCPYPVKPTELFKINEVCPAGFMGHTCAAGKHTDMLPCRHPTLQDKDMEKLRQLGGVTGLADTLQSHAHQGLDPGVTAGPASIEEHRRVFGPNTMPSMPQKNFFMLCFENIQDPIILLLIAAALVSGQDGMKPLAGSRMAGAAACAAPSRGLLGGRGGLRPRPRRGGSSAPAAAGSCWGASKLQQCCRQSVGQCSLQGGLCGRCEAAQAAALSFSWPCMRVCCLLQVSTVLGAALEEQRKEGEWIEGIAIWVAVAIVIMVGESPRCRMPFGSPLLAWLGGAAETEKGGPSDGRCWRCRRCQTSQTLVPDCHLAWQRRVTAVADALCCCHAGAGNDYQKDLQFRKLNKQKDIIDVTVTRGSQPLVRLWLLLLPLRQPAGIAQSPQRRLSSLALCQHTGRAPALTPGVCLAVCRWSPTQTWWLGMC